MSAVAGIRRTMKELVDGTIRVQVDIHPNDRDSFLKLFPQIDMPIALAPLVPDYEKVGFPVSPIASIASTEARSFGDSTWHALGPLCQSAIMLGKDERFQKWVVSLGGGDPDDFIRTSCGVESRKQFDESETARNAFKAMMTGYRRWLDEQDAA